MELWEIVSARIRSLCADRHITLHKLATMSGLSSSTLDSIIKGSSKNPGIGSLVKIANAFNMTVSEFLDTPALNNYSPDDTSEDD